MNLNKSLEYFNPTKNCDSRIHIIGCGSVGSTVAESLARFGITKITLYDFDTVEAHNLANQMFRTKDIHKLKVEAVAEILEEINPDITEDLELEPEGWVGQRLSGIVILAVDNIELRRKIVEENRENAYIKLMLDFRTGLTDAQHYAAQWNIPKRVESFYNSMNFTHEEAKQETPVSACNVTLSVNPTVRMICHAGVANLINYLRGEPLKNVILIDAFSFSIVAM